jgi:hypothetical protein
MRSDYDRDLGPRGSGYWDHGLKDGDKLKRESTVMTTRLRSKTRVIHDDDDDDSECSESTRYN